MMSRVIGSGCFSRPTTSQSYTYPAAFFHCCSICLAILGALAVIAYRFIATKK